MVCGACTVTPAVASRDNQPRTGASGPLDTLNMRTSALLISDVVSNIESRHRLIQLVNEGRVLLIDGDRFVPSPGNI